MCVYIYTLYIFVLSTQQVCVLEERWKITDTWQLNTGLRYDEHSRYGEELTPKLALNKKLNDDSNIYVSWGEVFKAPTIDQLYYPLLDDMPCGNPNLNPEKGEVWTLGINTKLSDKTTISGSLFYSNIDDAIDYTWSTITPTYINVNKEKRRGMEISMNHEFDEHLSGYASYTYMQIKQDTGNGYNSDDKEKPNTYRLGLKYDINEWGYTADITAVSGQRIGVANGYTDKNYLILDLGIEYKLKNNVKIFAKGFNLTNERYQEIGGLYPTYEAKFPMPSRSFIIGAEYTF